MSRIVDWLQRRHERRITRAWVRESAGDREFLEGYFTYETDANGVTVMTPKTDPAAQDEP